MGRKSKRKSKSSVSPQVKAEVKILGIKERLELPVYHGSEDDQDQGEELHLEFRPRPYFVGGLCHLCSNPCDGIGLACSGCGLVAYCSPRHCDDDRTAHGQLCSVLGALGKRALALAKGLGPEEYRDLRVDLVRLAEEALAKPMEPREREVLLYPRLCRLCHGAEDLVACPDCHIELFCAKEPGCRASHAEHCSAFRVFGRILSLEAEGRIAPPAIPDFGPGTGLLELPPTYDDFIREILARGRSCDYESMDCASYAALSQVVTPTLTVLYALLTTGHLTRNTHCKLFKIHMIGAELQFECGNLITWEKLFLHHLPGVKNLKLELYGPELQVPDYIAKVLERPKLCKSCRAQNRRMDIVFHCGKLYHQVETEKPDLVCLFNPGLYRTTGFANQDSWPKTIEKFCNYGKPILVTSYTEVELPLDLTRLYEYQELQIDLAPQRNPFASLRPERNFVSDHITPLIYKNYFLSLVKGISTDVVKIRD